ncbi:hypothetical protein EIP91_002663 [Steccherinum ochraceum]|uniref:F-box domain-containing protein n=1 Tax=Steccherinum ochraceum TaxID=92696 RepID=A0A4R0RBQ0_9APHY|nr:hypothetical protein EIP91_002663 [Steccherinum ochraceum]
MAPLERTTIHSLPTEIIVSVFERVAWPMGGDWDPARVFLLTRICRHWRVLVVRNPRLWTKIVVRTKKILKCFLHHSKDLPVSIWWPTKWDVSVSVDEALEVLAPHSSRFSSLELFCSIDEDDNEEPDKKINLLAFPMPQLKHLTLELHFERADLPRVEDYVKSNLLLSTQLESLTLIDAILSPDCTPYHNLRSLSLCEQCVGDSLDMLQACPFLIHLEFLYVGCFDWTSRVFSQPPRRVSLPALQSFHCFAGQEETIAFAMAHLDLPARLALSIFVDGGMTDSALDCLSDDPQYRPAVFSQVVDVSVVEWHRTRILGKGHARQNVPLPSVDVTLNIAEGITRVQEFPHMFVGSTIATLSATLWSFEDIGADDWREILRHLPALADLTLRSRPETKIDAFFEAIDPSFGSHTNSVLPRLRRLEIIDFRRKEGMVRRCLKERASAGTRLTQLIVSQMHGPPRIRFRGWLHVCAFVGCIRLRRVSDTVIE